MTPKILFGLEREKPATFFFFLKTGEEIIYDPILLGDFRLGRRKNDDQK